MTSAELLRAAANLIKDGHWIQSCYAKNADGVSVLPRSSKAVCWCAVGALMHANGRGYAYLQAENELAMDVGGNVSVWNDGAPGITEKQVVKAMLATADRLEATL